MLSILSGAKGRNGALLCCAVAIAAIIRRKTGSRNIRIVLRPNCIVIVAPRSSAGRQRAPLRLRRGLVSRAPAIETYRRGNADAPLLSQLIHNRARYSSASVGAYTATWMGMA